MDNGNDPTPEEIRQACLRIQESWDDATRRLRAGWFAEQERIEVVTVQIDVVEAVA